MLGKSLTISATLAVVLVPLALAQPVSHQTAPAEVINKYCITCHSAQAKVAGVVLEGLDFSQPERDAAMWERVLRKIKSGQMPPPKLPHPAPADSEAFISALERNLDQAAATHPNPGRPTIHRLNRAEYSNAVRDVLALDVQPGSRLPADDTGYGFDNIGDVLSLSPMLIERYISTARLVSRLAVGSTDVKPETNLFEGAKGLRGRISDDLPFDSSGGIFVNYQFPADAEYVVRIKTPPSSPTPQSGPAPEPHFFELRIPVKAGTRKFGVTFLGENAAPEVIPAFGGRRGAGGAAPGPASLAKMDVRLDGVRLKLFDVPYLGTAPQLSNVTIAGPYNVTGAGDTRSRERIFVCRPASTRDEEPCARKIITSVGRRAYRRTFTTADLNPLLRFYETGRKEGNFDHGIEMAIRAMLVSPDFLFRIEHDLQGSKAGASHQVDGFELASRLSFFLWSSVPDDELLNLAEKGNLKEPAVLSAQVDRMLTDSRSKSFVNNFAGQWLYLRNLTQVKPDPDVFPHYDATLRQSFARETELFFDAIVRENRPVTDLLSADFTFLNQRLAEHYGIPNVYGAQFRKVVLTDPHRGGLLGQGSILTVTSYPNRTSVVQRGKWILENLLGAPPPPPPADVPALEEHKDGMKLTMRQQMEQHRKNPTCAACHARMDPIGFSLENYDGVGAYRAKDGGNTIDASGKLPDGAVFEGREGLTKLLLAQHRDEFLSTFTEKLLTYALGRGLEYYDEPAVRSILRNASSHDDTVPALIHAIVNSQPFQMRRNPES